MDLSPLTLLSMSDTVWIVLKFLISTYHLSKILQQEFIKVTQNCFALTSTVANCDVMSEATKESLTYKQSSSVKTRSGNPAQGHSTLLAVVGGGVLGWE